jgi:hypothetical protein
MRPLECSRWIQVMRIDYYYYAALSTFAFNLTSSSIIDITASSPRLSRVDGPKSAIGGDDLTMDVVSSGRREEERQTAHIRVTLSINEFLVREQIEERERTYVPERWKGMSPRPCPIALALSPGRTLWPCVPVISLGQTPRHQMTESAYVEVKIGSGLTRSNRVDPNRNVLERKLGSEHLSEVDVCSFGGVVRKLSFRQSFRQ